MVHQLQFSALLLSSFPWVAHVALLHVIIVSPPQVHTHLCVDSLSFNIDDQVSHPEFAFCIDPTGLKISKISAHKFFQCWRNSIGITSTCTCVEDHAILHPKALKIFCISISLLKKIYVKLWGILPKLEEQGYLHCKMKKTTTYIYLSHTQYRHWNWAWGKNKF